MGDRRYEDLPLEAKVYVNKLRETVPELADVAARMFPSEAEDRRRRAEREAYDRRVQEQRRRNREELCRKALTGANGKQVRAAAEAVLRECEGELTPTAVQRIVDIIRAAESQKRKAKGK